MRICTCLAIAPLSVLIFHFLTLQVEKFLEHVNCQLPNLSRNLFILFNHWDQVAGGDEESDSDDDDDDDDDEEEEEDAKQSPERVKEQHLERVRRFFEQGLKAKAVVDRTFFVSGREACKVQKEKGKQSTAGRSVVGMRSLYFPQSRVPHILQLSVKTTTIFVC